MHKRRPVKLTTDSLEMMEARRLWDDIFIVLKENNHPLRILYPTKLYFKMKAK